MKSNKIICNSVEICNNKIECQYAYTGDDTYAILFVDAFKAFYREDISEVPPSIAIIPFVCNILPIIWLTDTELVIEEIDKDFFESVEQFKNGYINMYPDFEFKGKVTAKKIVKNTYNSNKSAVLFSGGVDAFTTLISHLEEKPELITLWGADITFENSEGWQVVEKQVESTAKLLDLDYNIIRTNLRSFTTEKQLSNLIKQTNVKLGWWHDFQHGIGIISHAAPLAYQHGIGKVYIASSFTAADIGHYTCASDPTIDNYVRFGSTIVIHDGYELNRQMKIHKICNFIENFPGSLPIRVCWESTGGKNCCHCEKCYRTMIGILAEGKNPQKFGFDLYNEACRRHMLHSLRYTLIAKHNFNRYGYIQKTLQERYTYQNCPEDLKWFYKMKITDHIPWHEKIYLKTVSKLRKLKKMMN